MRALPRIFARLLSVSIAFGASVPGSVSAAPAGRAADLPASAGTAASPKPLSRADWGAAIVSVGHAGHLWTITGRRRVVTLDETSLALSIRSGPAEWSMVPATGREVLLRGQGEDFATALSAALTNRIVPYDAGFKTGVKISLRGWKGPSGRTVDAGLTLTVALEGSEEDLVCDASADERAGTVRRLDWPTALQELETDTAVLSNGRGTLLPGNWPKVYSPILHIGKDGAIDPADHSLLQSHLIECWSMSWWGFERGKSALMLIVETPDDAGCRFDHPAGGPSVIGPRWLPTLGRFGYPRSVRLCFLDEGDYVAMAKRYRRQVQDSGLYVSLREKIARTPGLADLIGTPHTRIHILTDLSRDSDRYDGEHPERNHTLVTFDESARQLRALKASGVDRTVVYVAAWQHQGYDHQHPDPLPPPEAAGGWAGLERLCATCRELGFPLIFHDQYRDYYVSAPSYDPQFAIHEEDDGLPAVAFAGSRFGDWKEGPIPFMRHWDGGRQSYLNARFQLGHLQKNTRLFFDHGIHPQGIYIDVIGYVPPDEDFNAEHPTTRTQAMQGEEALLNWSRNNIGFTVTEAGSDWVVPYADVVNQSGGVGKAIPVPLYELVYHDAIMITYGARGEDSDGLLRGMLCGGVPELPVSAERGGPARALVQRMQALHRRVALLEMTRHEFLDSGRNRERTAFSDGTTVTVDWQAKTAEVVPALP